MMILPLLIITLTRGQLSQKSCAEFGWSDEVLDLDNSRSAFKGQIGVAGVCGTKSEKDAVCGGALAWTESTCAGIGARLCTQEEYEALEAGSSGCGYESKLWSKFVWTSTECTTDSNQKGHIATSIANLGKKVVSECKIYGDIAFGGRCCADVFTNAPTTWMSSAPTQAPEDCTPREVPIDIYFLVDGSSSIKDTPWGYLKEFIHEFIEKGINVEGDRIGVVQFAGRGKSRVEFTFDDGVDTVKANIRDMDQMKGGTKTDEGIQEVIDSWKTEKEPLTHPDRERLMMLITDGVPNPASQNPCVGEQTEVGQLNALKIETVILGVDIAKEDIALLDCLVDDPARGIIDIDGFTDFSRWRDPTENGILCIPDGFAPLVSLAPTPAPTFCVPRKYPIDVYFLVDGSISITKKNFIRLGEAIKYLLEYALDIEGDRIGFVQFGGKKPVVEFTFADGLDYIMDNIMSVSQIKGGTKTDWGIQTVLEAWKQEEVLQETRHKLMVLITDGVPNPEEHNPCGPGHTEKADLDDFDVETVILGIAMSHNDTDVLSCLVEVPERNIVNLESFEDFSNWRDPTDENLLCLPQGIFNSLAPTAFTSQAPTPEPTEEQGRSCGKNGKLIGKANKKLSGIMSSCECKDRCSLVSEDITNYRYHAKKESCSCYKNAKVKVPEYVVGGVGDLE